MLKLFAPRDLTPIPAIAMTAFVALAIFGWTERTVLVDPDGLSVPHWPWKLWQIAPLLMGLGGAWWIWSSTRRVPGCAVWPWACWPRWSWSTATATFSETIGATCGAPSIPCSSGPRPWRRWRSGDAGVFLRAWQRRPRCRWAPGFANAYFVNNGTLWQALDPLRMLAELAWAAGATQVNVATSTGGSSPGEG